MIRACLYGAFQPLGCALAIGIAAASAAASAGAGEAPVRDPESTVIQSLVVTAPLRGPAWWSVTNGDSTVWILATPSALPHKLPWDRQELKRRLRLSRTAIMPPRATAGLGDLFGFLSVRAKMKNPLPLEQRAPETVKARFLASAAALGKPPSAYDRWNGLVAGLLMTIDFRRSIGIDREEPEGAIEREARAAGIPLTYSATYRALAAVRSAAREVTPAIEWTCVDAAADEIAAGRSGFDTAAAAWARGDTRVALTAGRGFEACVNALPVGADLARQAITDETAVIDKALHTPGHVVAVVPIRGLLAEDGVLDRLRRAGYKVTGRGG